MNTLDQIAKQHEDSPESRLALKALAIAFLYSASPSRISDFVDYISGIDPEFSTELRATAIHRYKQGLDK